MRKSDSRITSAVYAQLKNDIYRIFLANIQKPEDNKIERMYAAVGKFNIESLDEITRDTVEFPFVKELFSYYKDNLNKSYKIIKVFDDKYNEALLQNKIYIRKFKSGVYRITVGTQYENEKLLEVLKNAR